MGGSSAGGGGMVSQNNIAESDLNWESRLPRSMQRLV